MFTLSHIIWMIISIIAIFSGVILLKKYRLPLDKVLSIACVGSVLSEIVKTLAVIKMVPLGNGSGFTPYLEMEQVPLHLCSFQIILIFIVKFTKKHNLKQLLLSFMYPTCTIGAFLAIVLPSIFNENNSLTDAFLKAHPYQYFLYHAMLVILGTYILISGEAKIKPKNYLTTMAILISLAFFSFYLNSIFAIPTYQNGEIISIQHMPNFFFTFLTPISIPLTKLWHWYLYLGIIVALSFSLIALLYIPVFIKAKKEKNKLNIDEKEKAFSR